MLLNKFRLEWLTLAAVAAIVTWQILVPPPIGLGDNGDFPRIAGRFSLGPSTAVDINNQFSYFQRIYVEAPRHFWNSGFVSSESLLAGIAISASRLLTRCSAFNIQWLGVVHLLLFLGAVWLLLRCSRPLTAAARVTVSLLILLVLCDVGYTAYFNSFYSEPASFLFGIAALAAGLAVWNRSPIPFILLGLLFVTAKPQNAPLGLLLASFCAWLAWATGRGRRRVILIAAALVLTIGSRVYYWSTPVYLSRHYLYHAVFFELLRFSPSPGQDLKELGLDPGLARWVGTTVFDPRVHADSPEFQAQFFGRITPAKITKFYLRHPGRLYACLERGASRGWRLRPWYLGNFEKSSGYPPKTLARSPWSWFRDHVLPRNLWFLAGVWAAAAACGLFLIRRHGPVSAGGAAGAILVTVVLMSAEQFVSSLIGSGLLEAEKHMFLSQMLFDVSICATLVFAVQWAAVHRKGFVRHV